MFGKSALNMIEFMRSFAAGDYRRITEAYFETIYTISMSVFMD